jgi:hypothetical protein
VGQPAHQGNFIPITEPYSHCTLQQHLHSRWGGGGETIANPAAVFGVTGNDAIVDWVFVELRDRNNMSNVVVTRSALLQRDGDVVDVDGVSPLCFTGPGRFALLYHHSSPQPLWCDDGGTEAADNTSGSGG